jgi:hypothetical protein
MTQDGAPNEFADDEIPPLEVIVTDEGRKDHLGGLVRWFYFCYWPTYKYLVDRRRPAGRHESLSGRRGCGGKESK